MKKRSIVTTLALTASTLSGVLATHVDAAPASCAANYICIYEHSGFGGAQYSVTGAAPSVGSMNDKASSLGNSKASNRARYFQHDSYVGWYVCVSAGNSASSLFSDRNDEISSMAIQIAMYC